MNTDSTRRFSNNVEKYIKYRPSYPAMLIDFFTKKLKGSSKAIIADIGSGTGLLAQLFLQNGNPVFGIEPNKQMREVGNQLLKKYPNFKSINGTAEATQLPNQSVDFIMAGQAFHWFDVEKSKKEFHRILKPNGQVLLIWNTRDDAKSDFMKKYNEFLLSYSTDYQLIMHRRLDDLTFERFYGNQEFKKEVFENFQIFDLDGLIGRYLSCSYAYDSEHPDHEKAMLEIKNIFRTYQENGQIKMWYNTELYHGYMK